MSWLLTMLLSIWIICDALWVCSDSSNVLCHWSHQSPGTHTSLGIVLGHNFSLVIAAGIATSMPMPKSTGVEQVPAWLNGAAYPAGANCTLGIRVHPGSHVELRLVYMKTEYPYDYLQVYDMAAEGSMELSNPMETLSGEQTGRVIAWTPSKGEMWFVVMTATLCAGTTGKDSARTQGRVCSRL